LNLNWLSQSFSMANLRKGVLWLVILLLMVRAQTFHCLAQPNNQSVSPSLRHSPGGSEKGHPYLRNYGAKEYGAFVQNWAVLQDQQGIMYFGNGHGVLTYNGVSWRLIQTPDKTIVRSLAMDESGRVYAGAADDLGYLAPDSVGKPSFHSLLKHLKPEDRYFADVWKIHPTPEGVYFQTDQYLFRWAEGRFKQWKADSMFYWSFQVNHRLYIQDRKKGLLELKDDAFHPIAQGDRFTDRKVQTMLPLDRNRILIGTRQDGLFVYDGTSIVPFESEINDFLKKNELYQAQALPDGNYALATMRGGAVWMDKQGKVLGLINKAKGLPTDAVYNLGTDAQGGWWLALEKGISRVEMTSVFSGFGEAEGLEGAVNALARHQGQLYAATSMGLFRLDAPPAGWAYGETSARFRVVPGLSESCWSLYSDGISLLVSTDQGAYQLKNNQVTRLNPYRANTLHRSRKDPSRLFITLEDGLASLRWDGHQWRNEGRFAGIREEIHTAAETPDGRLWLSTFWQGIVRLSFPDSAQPMAPRIERLGQAEGLPKGYVKVVVTNGEAWVGMDDDYRLYRFDEATRRFRYVSNQDFARKFGLTEGEAYPSGNQPSADTLWVRARSNGTKRWQRVRLLRQPDGTYQRQTVRLDRITENVGRTFYPEPGGLVWYAGPDGIVRQELKDETSALPGFQTLIDRIVINRDSLVYPSVEESSFAYPYNSLRFELGAPSYDHVAGNEFQYRLEGYDDDWSAWGPESFREYTRIPAGEYAFVAHSRNIHGHVGQPATYRFRIAPPWYQTWPMYGLYALLAAGLMYIIVRWRLGQLREKNVALEAIVRERTHEIAAKNQLLEGQAGQLEKQTRQLRELDQAKSNFFANISHEFRTPLTLILGTLSDKLSGFRQPPNAPATSIPRTEVKVMHRNAQRLLQLVNQLLDLSKVESGQMTLQAQNVDLNQLLNVVVASFSSLATFHRLRFYARLPTEPILCRLDVDQTKKILYNLLSNAFKFTPDGGEISLAAEVITAPESLVQLTVQDSGPGIAANQLEKVFDRFYQGSQSYQSDQQGTGIGLALTRELVQLHGGTIRVESEPGQGARFIVQFPLVPFDSAPVASLTSTDYLVETDPANDNIPATSDPLLQVLPENAPLPVLLLVEDNADLRHYIRAQVAKQYQVLESENGLQGWETALEHLPDLIISDWMMPEMSGIELCQRLKTDERTSHIPVVLLTALATTEGKMTGLETGADEYLTKPFDARELHLRIRNLIESRRKLRERFSREIRVQPTDITVTSADEQFLQRVMRIVEEHLGDSEFSAEQFCREVGLSRMQLHRKLTALTGQSAGDFIRLMRLKRAAQLLEAQSATVSEIAYEVGFNTLFYFSKCFKEQFGVPPSEYKVQAGAQMK
jgi:signal transduction histidine kinase/DNA-binding response OmpR family regulator/ligand-binding sensor domain-containing protein